MVGLQATAIKMQLGPLLNGIVVYDFWLPWAGFATDEGRDFVKKYQAKAAAAGVDLLGYYLPPFAYALHAGDRAGGRGRRAAPTTPSSPSSAQDTPSRPWSATSSSTRTANGQTAQVMAVQFQGVQGNGVEQFTDPKTEVILWPTKYKTGDIIYPYDPKK